MTLKSSTLVLIAAAAGAATTAACSDNDLVLPQPPQDLTATVQAYETPTGTIDFAHLEQVAADARADLASRNLDWLPGLVSDALVAVRRRFDDGGYPVNPSIPRKQNRAKVDAVVQVQHLCGGWTGQPTGNVDLTAVISDTELEHAVWGNAANCQARVDVDTSLGLNVVPTVNGFFDGTVAVFLEGSLPETDRQGQLVVAVSGEIGVQDHTGLRLVRLQDHRRANRDQARRGRRRHHRGGGARQRQPAREQRHGHVQPGRAAVLRGPDEPRDARRAVVYRMLIIGESLVAAA